MEFIIDYTGKIGGTEIDELKSDIRLALHHYKLQHAPFERSSMRKVSGSLSPLDSWQSVQPHNQAADSIRNVAIRLFAIPTSSASCEPVGSNYNFIHNKRRSLSKDDRVYKKVYIY